MIRAMSHAQKLLNRPAALLLAAVSVAGMAIRFCMFLQTIGHFAHAVFAFFSYFTLLSNLIATGSLLHAATTRSERPASPMTASIEGAALVYLLIAGLVFELLLKGQAPPGRASFIADLLLHMVMPVGYFLYWLLLAPPRNLPWKSVGLWLLFPLGYAITLLLIGQQTHSYPYTFLDAGNLGWPRTFVNIAVLTSAFAVLSAAIVWLDRNVKPDFAGGSIDLIVINSASLLDI